jgi:hypothetical protein
VRFSSSFYATLGLTTRRADSNNAILRVLTLPSDLLVSQLPSSDTFAQPPVPPQSLMTRARQVATICFMFGDEKGGESRPDGMNAFSLPGDTNIWSWLGFDISIMTYAYMGWRPSGGHPAPIRYLDAPQRRCLDRIAGRSAPVDRKPAG